MPSINNKSRDEMLKEIALLSFKLGRTPTLREIGKVVGYSSTSSVHNLMQHFEANGDISYLDNHRRHFVVNILYDPIELTTVSNNVAVDFANEADKTAYVIHSFMCITKSLEITGKLKHALSSCAIKSTSTLEEAVNELVKIARGD